MRKVASRFWWEKDEVTAGFAVDLLMEKLREVKHLLVTVFLSSFATVIVVPAITDVTIFAVCPDSSSTTTGEQYQCSLAIYLIGFQQAMIGMGTVVMMPVIGNLSDQYGRKALLTLPLTISIIPLVILAYSRTTNFFYAYYVLKILTAMVSEGSISCLALAYVAETIPVGQRTSAFGIVCGITSASYVCGTLAARFLSTASTFQVAAFVSILAVVYMRIFLKESLHFPDGERNLTHPILQARSQDGNRVDGDAPVFKKIPTPGDLISLLKNRPTFSQAAVVAFFYTLSYSGAQACILLYLKARFHFSKDQFAVLMLLISIAGMISQLILMPLLAPFISEEKLLSIGLLVTFIQNLLCSIAWSAWVPYALNACFLFATFVLPCLHSIASKQVGPYEQGKAQGCISGISSIANILAPLIFSPLTALFLSEQAPFHFPGFSILCIGFAALIAFFQSLMIRPVPPPSNRKIITNTVEA